LPYFNCSAVSFIGLFLIAIGTGGIKPCVAPFGAEQFELPQQESQMKTFFSWFYASINSGAMISSILTPYLRNSPCFGQETCFPLAFGVPSALMVVALCKFKSMATPIVSFQSVYLTMDLDKLKLEVIVCL